MKPERNIRQMLLIVFQSWKIQKFLVQMTLGLKLEIVSNHRQRKKQGFWKHKEINPGSIRNAQNQLERENRQHYFDYEIQTTKLQKILLILDTTPVEPSEETKRDYMKTKVNKLEENHRNKNIQEMYKGVNDFKKGNQPRSYVTKKDDGTLVADTACILTRWEQFYSHLLNVI